MAIEMRNGMPYYYTSRRIGSRVVREYQGCGLRANLSAESDEMTRNGRTIDRDLERLRRAKRQRINAKLRKWLVRINATVAQAMLANGWHQHNREWRRKRGNAMGTLATTDAARSTWVLSELGAMAGKLNADVIVKARKGARSMLPEIDGFLDNPAATALYGDIGRHVLHKWVILQAGEDILRRQAMLRFASDMRTRLAGANPTALDYLLAERVVLTWTFLNFCDIQYIASIEKLTADRSQFHFKRIEMANRNLMAACRTLAKVKKAKLPDVLAVVNVTVGEAEKNCT